MKTNYIDLIIRYIENNLSSDINPEKLAEKFYTSPRQFYRDFSSCTGHSVKDYIIKRRISNACEKLKCSDISLAYIASEIGYKTQQAFNKQFKNLVGMTPLEYKKSNTYFYFPLFQISGASIVIKVGTEIIPQCEIRNFYSPKLSGIEADAIASLTGITGRVFGKNGRQVKNKFCYQLMIESTETAVPIEKQTQTYATCVVKYNEREINRTWGYLYNSWLTSSMFEQDDASYFEEYMFKNGKPYKLKLYLPVKKRDKINHIMIKPIEEMTFLIARESFNIEAEIAEQKASTRVVNFLTAKYPFLLEHIKNFYICENEGIYTCGMEVSRNIKIDTHSGLELLHIEKGHYALLSGECFGDIKTESEKITQWAERNGIKCKDEPVFAIYEKTKNNNIAAKDGEEKIRTTVYKRLSLSIL